MKIVDQADNLKINIVSNYNHIQYYLDIIFELSYKPIYNRKKISELQEIICDLRTEVRSQEMELENIYRNSAEYFV